MPMSTRGWGFESSTSRDVVGAGGGGGVAISRCHSELEGLDASARIAFAAPTLASGVGLGLRGAVAEGTRAVFDTALPIRKSHEETHSRFRLTLLLKCGCSLFDQRKKGPMPSADTDEI